jgi:putative transposase of IS4/5 family DUF4096
LVVERSVQALLDWSSWRRWHQAWARYYHYRRRGNFEQPRAEEQKQVVAKERTDEVWQRLEQLLPDAHRVGRPYDYSRRLVLEAIVHVMQSNCGWRKLPSRFPPWQTVYAQLRQWRKKGIWDKIWSGFDQPLPTDELQL